jgi:Tol biopolymer transport system component
MTRFRLLLAALPWLLFAPRAAAAPHPRVVPVLPVLATASSMQGRNSLWRVPVQGSHRPVALFTAPANDTLNQPVWSPDGSHLAYVLNGRELVQAANNGRDPRVLYGLPASSFQLISGPRYTPDGKTLGFTVGCCGTFAMYRIGTNGRGLRQLSRGGVRIFQDWSPDGTHFLYTLNGQLWTADPLGGHATPIGNDTATAGNFFDARYSPDNTHIVASLQPAEGSAEGSGRVIVLMHDDGKYLSVLTRTVPFDCSDPTWSPDGKRIAFVVASGPIGPLGRLHEIWIMRFNGRDRKNLTHGILGDVSAIAWER